MKLLNLLFASLLCTLNVQAQSTKAPVSLRTDLIEHTDIVNIGGQNTQLSLKMIDKAVEPIQLALIASKEPMLSWQIDDNRESIKQTAYKIELSDSLSFNNCLWDSGKQFVSEPYTKYKGDPLKINSIYYWRVKFWNNLGEESVWSDAKAFKTADKLTDYASNYYPLNQQDQLSGSKREIDDTTTFYDFEKAAFGRLKVTIDSKLAGDTMVVRLGEVIASDGLIDRKPGGSRRYREMMLPLKQGRHTYTLAIEKNLGNTTKQAVLMPDYIGDVLPFRYCEITSTQQPEMVIREMVTYNFNDYNSHFHSSDTLLNKIWDFCKYSIKATSFAGYYVDGDRERIPYEADAYINQLCHYAVDSEYTLGRRTAEYFIYNPTWPTEWILTTVLMAWTDYLYTANPDFIEHYYSELQKKCFTSLLDDNGLISTRTGKLTDSVRNEVHYNRPGKLRDIVDWPHKGSFGMSEDNSGETDGFVFTDYNTVVNAYHNKALQVMSEIAHALGKEDDSRYYSDLAKEHKKAFNNLLFDKESGYYRDGVDTDHSSLHSNMFALAFGLVPERHLRTVTDFAKSRGMACSVYGSQHLLDAIYAGEDGMYGMELLTSRSDRGWAHAIYNVGTTITLEAWDNKYKPNQDWNHAWGAAPANVIPMRLMGIQPTAPGFEKFRIKPQPANLEYAEVSFPTIRGTISVKFDNRSDFIMDVVIPSNSEAEIWVPNVSGKKLSLYVNGNKMSSVVVRGFVCLKETLESGTYKIELK